MISEKIEAIIVVFVGIALILGVYENNPVVYGGALTGLLAYLGNQVYQGKALSTSTDVINNAIDQNVVEEPSEGA